MKISEVLAGLANTLRDKGDLDVWFCVRDTTTDSANTLKSIPLISGGWVNNNEGLPVAFLSPENLEGVLPDVKQE